MLFNQFIDLSIIISITATILLGALICYKLIKLNKLINGLSKRVNKLGSEMSIQTIEDFINYINEKYEPTRYYANDFIKAGYRLIDMDEDIDADLKLKVKIVILSKGIIVD